MKTFFGSIFIIGSILLISQSYVTSISSIIGIILSPIGIALIVRGQVEGSIQAMLRQSLLDMYHAQIKQQSPY